MHNHWDKELDVQKYLTPPPLKNPVAQWNTILTNDVTMNVKYLIHTYPCLQDIFKFFLYRIKFIHLII